MSNLFKKSDAPQVSGTWKKGSCTNCGNPSHQARDCLERPRQRGAVFTNKVTQNTSGKDNSKIKDAKTFEEKRDRWAEYDPNEFVDHAKNFSEEELERRKKKSNELEKRHVMEPEKDANRFPSGNPTTNPPAVGGAPTDQTTVTTLKSMRLREDTAKYLNNLEENELWFDPKTRILIDTNTGRKIEPEGIQPSNSKFLDIQQFAWEQGEQGIDVNLEANPSETELMYKEYLDRKEQAKLERDRLLKSKYNVDPVQDVPKEFLVNETEDDIEYDKNGQPIKRKQQEYPDDNAEPKKLKIDE